MGQEDSQSRGLEGSRVGNSTQFKHMNITIDMGFIVASFVINGIHIMQSLNSLIMPLFGGIGFALVGGEIRNNLLTRGST